MENLNLNEILKLAREKEATDVHIILGSPLMFRINNELVPQTENLTAEQTKELSYSLLSKDQQNKFEAKGDLDMMYEDVEGRYRVNIAYDNKNVGATIRIFPTYIRTIDDLFLSLPSANETIKDFAHKEGLVLIAGGTSQGKTTTMAAMIEEINRTEKKKIITIEDPVEYKHKNNKSVICQREVGEDTKSFASGLKAALRQNPDVIAIGEMRDYESIMTTLEAARKGNLIISTLQSRSIEDIPNELEVYASSGREQILLRNSLSRALEGIIYQELLPKKNGGKVLAYEILVATLATRNIIKEYGGAKDSLQNQIDLGQRYGMVQMKDSIAALFNKGLITGEVRDKSIGKYTRK